MDYLGVFEPSYSYDDYDDEPVKKKTILDVPPEQLDATEGDWERVLVGGNDWSTVPRVIVRSYR